MIDSRTSPAKIKQKPHIKTAVRITAPRLIGPSENENKSIKSSFTGPKKKMVVPQGMLES